MGWQDRNYGHQPPGRGLGIGIASGSTGRSIVFWLITINIVVFILDAILKKAGAIYPFGLMVMGPLEYWGHFSADTSVFHFQIWRFVTFQFLHAGIGHIFFNMLALYFFGPIIDPTSDRADS